MKHSQRGTVGSVMCSAEYLNSLVKLVSPVCNFDLFPFALLLQAYP